MPTQVLHRLTRFPLTFADCIHRAGGERQRQGGAPRPAAMFEKQLASVLNKVLGEYVEGLDHDALSLSVWKVLPPMTSRASLPRTCHVVRRTHA